MHEVLSKPADNIIDEFLKSSPESVVAAEETWLREQVNEDVYWIGEEPNAEALIHFLNAHRTLTDHAQRFGQIRTVIVPPPGGPAMKLANIIVVFDQGDQQTNLDIAYHLARQAKEMEGW